MIALKNILVATDFSEPSKAALTYGRALARNFGAALHVVQVVGRVPMMVYGAEAYSASIPELQHELEASARAQLAEFVAGDDQPPAKQIVITSDAPAVAIVDYAARGRMDLIITGTHGRGGMAHLLMGSVTERIVRTAPCPVLTVRHPEHEFVIPDVRATTVAANA